MEPFYQIPKFDMKPLNNSEYQNFMRRFLSLIPASEGASPVNIPPENVAEMDALLGKMTELNRESRAWETTPEKKEADRERSSVAAYILGRVLKSGSLLLDAERAAGRALKNTINPYKGVGRLPINQKTEVIKGLVMDLRKEELQGAVETLGLKPYLDELERQNLRFEALVAQESETRSEMSLGENNVAIRAQINVLYTKCIMLANATQVLAPSAESEAFIRDVNSLVEEVRIAYNLRNKRQRRRRRGSEII